MRTISDRFTTIVAMSLTACVVASSLGAQKAPVPPPAPLPPLAPVAPKAPVPPARIYPMLDIAGDAWSSVDDALDAVDWTGITDDATWAAQASLDDLAPKLSAAYESLSSVDLDLAPMIAAAIPTTVTIPRISFGFGSPRAYSLPSSPRAPWASDDPADSLYRVARQALNAGEYRRAAELFGQITTKYPKSDYASDAAYWRAFALYRIGDTADLHEALRALDSANAIAATADSARAAARVAARAARASRSTARAAAANAKNAVIISGGDLTPEALAAVTEATTNAANAANSVDAMTIARSFSTRWNAADTESAVLAMRIRSALAARGDATAAAAIAKVAGTDATSCDAEDAQIRVEALNALVQMDPKNAEPAISKVLARRDKCSVALRRGAIALAARTPSPSTTQLLISTATNDPAIDVQAEAMRSLAETSDPAATAALTRFATSGSSSALQRIAVRSLAQQDAPAARTAIHNIINNASADNDVRITALHYAGKDLSITELSKLYDQSANRSMRREVINLLEKRKEPEAGDKLISIVRTSTDPSLRRSAIEALTRKKDPRTTKLLMDIIGK